MTFITLKTRSQTDRESRGGKTQQPTPHLKPAKKVHHASLLTEQQKFASDVNLHQYGIDELSSEASAEKNTVLL